MLLSKLGEDELQLVAGQLAPVDLLAFSLAARPLNAATTADPGVPVHAFFADDLPTPAFFRAEDAKALHALYQRARARECAAERAALDEILARTTAASDDALKRALLAWKHKHHE